MTLKRSIGEKIFDSINLILLFLVALLTLYPFWSVLVTSLVPYSESIKNSIHIIPIKITFAAYSYVFQSNRIINGFLCSIYITVGATFYQLLITSMAAYGLTKKDLPGRNLFFLLIIITMFFNGGLIPYYLLVKSLGLVNRLLVMIIPFGINTFHLLILKTFFNGIPNEMEESAKIDGMGFFRIFFSIIVPLSVPVLTTIGLFVAVAQWNNWYTPLIFINDRNKWPLAIILQEILINNDMNLLKAGILSNKDPVLMKSRKMSVVIVSIVPIIIIYPFIQKYFVKGMMIGAVKS